MSPTLEQRAEEIYQKWCEIDTPREKIHERVTSDILTALRQTREEALEEFRMAMSVKYFQLIAKDHEMREDHIDDVHRALASGSEEGK